MAVLEQILWYLNFLATLGLLVRLVQCGLTRTYGSLFWYWLAQAAATPVMLLVPLKSSLYTKLYFTAEVISLVLAIWVVLELYREALVGHSALARFGRQSVITLMGVAAIMAGFAVTLDSKILPGQRPAIHRFLILERTVSLMIVGFLLLMSAFLLWFPVKIKRNVVVYIVGFVLFYSSRSVGILLVNLLPATALQLMSIIVLGCTLVCLLLWVIGLRKGGEDVITITGNPSHAEALSRLSGQLDEINTALARFARNS
jgi:hypothetical protein